VSCRCTPKLPGLRNPDIRPRYPLAQHRSIPHSPCSESPDGKKFAKRAETSVGKRCLMVRCRCHWNCQPVPARLPRCVRLSPDFENRCHTVVAHRSRQPQPKSGVFIRLQDSGCWSACSSPQVWQAADPCFVRAVDSQNHSISNPDQGLDRRTPKFNISEPKTGEGSQRDSTLIAGRQISIRPWFTYQHMAHSDPCAGKDTTSQHTLGKLWRTHRWCKHIPKPPAPSLPAGLCESKPHESSKSFGPLTLTDAT
jgi:hypothetical protein